MPIIGQMVAEEKKLCKKNVLSPAFTNTNAVQIVGNANVNYKNHSQRNENGSIT